MALVSLVEAKSYLGLGDSEIHVGGLRVFVDAGPTAATVEVQAHNLQIIIVGGANPGTYDFDLTAAANLTMTLFAAVLNAHAAGITAEVLTYDDALSDDLVVVAAANCLGDTNTQTLQIIDNYKLNQIIDRISDWTERYCGIEFKAGALSERYDGNGNADLTLNNRPVNTVTRVSIGSTGIVLVSNTSTSATAAYVRVDATTLTLIVETGAATASNVLTLAAYATFTDLVVAINALAGWEASVSSAYADFSPTDLVVTESSYCLLVARTLDIFGGSVSDYLLFPDRGMIRLSSGAFSTGYRNVLVEYTYGYTIIPGALKEAVLRLISLAYHRSMIDPTLSSEKLGDHSWARATDALSSIQDDMESELALWRKYELC